MTGRKGADILWNKKTIEVKALHGQKDGWRFVLQNRNYDYYILFCCNKGNSILQVFIIPKSHINMLVFISRVHPSIKWDRYKVEIL